MGAGATIVQPGLTPKEKAQFTQELKQEFKAYINSLAADQAEKILRPVRMDFQDYKKMADEHRDMIVERFESELQKLADYMKKALS